MAAKRLGNRAIKARTDRRIEDILDLIAAGAWANRRTEQALAAKWSQEDGEPVAQSTVHNLAMQAFRIHELRYKNDPHIRTRLMARIEAIGDKALARVRQERRRVRGGGYEMVSFPDPDFKSALKAAELVGKEFGMFDATFRNNFNQAVGMLIRIAEDRLGPDAARDLFEAIAAMDDPRKEPDFEQPVPTLGETTKH